MVSDYIQAQLKMSEVQLLYAKRSPRSSIPIPCQKMSSSNSNVKENYNRLRAGDTNASAANTPEKPASLDKLDKTRSKSQKNREESLRLSPGDLSIPNDYTLWPSRDSSYLEDRDINMLRHRETIAGAIKANLHLKKPSSSLPNTSTLTLSKPLECFPTRNGDHRICYIELRNNSPQSVAYQVRTNCPQLYDISPATAWIPPEQTCKMCIRYNGDRLESADMESHKIIITTLSRLRGCMKTSARELLQLENLTPSSTKVFPLRDFVIHPCSIVPSGSIKHPVHTIRLDDTKALELNYSEAVRMEKLYARNRAEQMIDHLLGDATVSVGQLEILERKCSRIGCFFAVLSYMMFVAVLGLALYFCLDGARARREAEARKASWSNYAPISWMHRASQWAFPVVATAAHGWAMCMWWGFHSLILHPILSSLEWLSQHNPFYIT